MLASLIIVFREIFEASLIIGIVAAATRTVPNRTKWLVGGLLTGLAGAIIVAASAGTISTMLEGRGQEIFNAAILFLAVAMLAWHNIWMSSHGKALASELKGMSADVITGARPLYAVSIAVGLAVMREGSEIALFMYGIAAGGTENSQLLLGGLVGLLLGAGVGYALYRGLIHLSTQLLFTVTGLMILLLACGMASQGALALVQADILPPLGRAVWDSSSILSERSVFGNVLHSLVGYSARPLPIQLLFYLLTLTLTGGMMLFMRNASSKLVPAAAIAAGVFIGGSFAANEAHASSANVYSPYVEKGELEIEYKGTLTFDDDPTMDNQQKDKLAIGYGVTDYLAVELYGEWKKSPGRSRYFEATEIEARFQLTEPNEHWADLGFLVEFERPDNNANASKVGFGPLIAKDCGNQTTTANLIFESEVGDKATGSLEFEYALQHRWRLDEAFEPAIEVFGEFGEITNLMPFAHGEHKAGPAVQGKFRNVFGLPGAVKYDVGYLVGLTGDTAEGTLKTVLEYELHF